MSPLTLLLPPSPAGSALARPTGKPEGSRPADTGRGFQSSEGKGGPEAEGDAQDPVLTLGWPGEPDPASQKAPQGASSIRKARSFPPPLRNTRRWAEDWTQSSRSHLGCWACSTALQSGPSGAGRKKPLYLAAGKPGHLLTA